MEPKYVVSVSSSGRGSTQHCNSVSDVKAFIGYLMEDLRPGKSVGAITITQNHDGKRRKK